MAEPIKDIVYGQSDKQAEVNQELQGILEQLAEHRVVIEDLLIILENLHSSGIIDIVKSLLVKKAEVGFIAMEHINQPGTLNLLRNGMGAMELLSEIETEQLSRMFEGVKNGLEHTSKHADEKKPVGMWGAFKATKDPNIQYSINMMLHFLEGMGEKLNKEKT